MRTMYDKNKIQFALVNGKITHIKDITKKDIAICLECGEELIVRAGTKNIKHLAHSSDTECKYHKDIEHCNESYQHKYVKNYIKENIQVFKKLDAILGNTREINIIDSKLEYTKLKQELQLENMYIPDVLLITPEGYICLEIYKTNKKDNEYIKNILYPRNIQVYEIDINNIDIANLSMSDIYSNTELIYDANLIAHKEKEHEIKVLTEYNLQKEFMEHEKKLEREFEEKRNELIRKYNYKKKQLEESNVETRKMLIHDSARRIHKSQEDSRVIIKAMGAKAFDRFRNTLKEDIDSTSVSYHKMKLKELLQSYNGTVGALISNINLYSLEKILRIHKLYYAKREVLTKMPLNKDDREYQINIWKELLKNNSDDLNSLTEINKLLK